MPCFAAEHGSGAPTIGILYLSQWTQQPYRSCDNTKASVDAVTELAAALKVKYGEERKDKFGETTKVVKQPGTFQPTTLEEEHS